VKSLETKSKMSRDVAKIIYDMSCANDTSYDAKLKEIYKKKNPPKEDLKFLLYRTVATYIKENNQKTNLVLSHSIYHLTSGELIENFTIHSKYDKIDKLSLKYSFIRNNKIYVVHDVDTRRLIDEAIIPLDLRWCAYPMYCDDGSIPVVYSIVVSWDHWKNNKK
jgi:hypothetical protein